MRLLLTLSQNLLKHFWNLVAVKMQWNQSSSRDLKPLNHMKNKDLSHQNPSRGKGTTVSMNLKNSNNNWSQNLSSSNIEQAISLNQSNSTPNNVNYSTLIQKRVTMSNIMMEGVTSSKECFTKEMRLTITNVLLPLKSNSMLQNYQSICKH